MVIARLGDGALRLELPPGADRRALLARLRGLPGVIDAVITERHAVVCFDPAAGPPALAPALELRVAPGAAAEDPPATHRIRIRYDGPDLELVARHAGLAVDEVIALHAAATYVVEVVGFQPGFAYLGAVDPRIAAPRLPRPRPRVPARSVGIAGGRTGIYPFASPGGWNLVGTAVDFVPFDPERGARLRLGDRVVFERG